MLAGGEGRRMGGVDKGLQVWRGRPLVAHALARLAPQVGSVLINANRHLVRYAAYGHPVVPDLFRPADEPHAGPLAGLQAVLSHCTTSWLLSVPCDSPLFPSDLCARLMQAVQAHGADLAVACSASSANEPARTHPVFCLLHTELLADLTAYLQGGGRRVNEWAARHRRVQVPFDDPAAFTNFNTLGDLAS